MKINKLTRAICVSLSVSALLPTGSEAVATVQPSNLDANAQADESNAAAQALPQPIDSLSAGPANGGWQAQLALGLVPDKLLVTLNGKQANYLFDAKFMGPQTAWLAPDDGLRYGNNVLKVAAIYQKRIYPIQEVKFKVARNQLLPSAGPDQRVRTVTPLRLDGHRSRGLSRRRHVAWRILRAPTESKASLLEANTLHPSFIPDVHGTYEIELALSDPRTGVVGRDVMTAKVYPNMPQIGLGIDTMQPQPDGSLAIAIGTNCAPEIMGCPSNARPGTFRTYPYAIDGTLYPVQLLILDRETLELLNDPNTWQVNFKGNDGDFYNIGEIIRCYQQQDISNCSPNHPVKKSNPNPLVILAALPGLLPGNTGTNQLSTLETYLISKVNTPIFELFPRDTNVGGWSAVGVALDPSNHPAGPTGYFNPGGDDNTVGNARMTGYFQFDSTGTYYNFTPGAYASFNTASLTDPTSQPASNVMSINGTSYSSEQIGNCGGFHLVTLDAASLQPSPLLPANQTFSTNCGNSSDTVAIENLAQALNNIANVPNGSNGAYTAPGLVFLQSIGTPISPSNLYIAASALSVPIEQLGGIADAFNKSMQAQTGYALAGSNVLLGDAPYGAQVGVYGPEASGAATGMVAGQPVLLEGLLQRGHVWHYYPVLGSNPAYTTKYDQGGNLLSAEPGLLPVGAYQPPSAWPTPTTPGELGALNWFYNYFGLESGGVVCYTPTSNTDFRSQYCDLSPATRYGSGWKEIAYTLNNYTNSKKPSIPYPGANACNCSEAEYNNVYFDLANETRWLVRTQKVINDLQLIYGTYNPLTPKQPNTPTVNLESAIAYVNSVLVKQPSPTKKIAGFWSLMGGDSLTILGAFATAAEDDFPGASLFSKVVGIMAGFGTITGDGLTGYTGESQLDQIVQTTASQLPGAISAKYDAASRQLGRQGAILLGDYEKLKVLGESLLFETSWSGNAQLQENLSRSAARFGYGRLLGAVYQAYGLLPSENNDEGGPGSPNQYQCVTPDWTDYPFPAHYDSKDLAYINFTTLQNNSSNTNHTPTLPIYGSLSGYGGSPYYLVLGYHAPTTSDGWHHDIPPATLMQPVFSPAEIPENAGFGEWPTWFFRRNFNQIGWSCNSSD